MILRLYAIKPKTKHYVTINYYPKHSITTFGRIFKTWTGNYLFNKYSSYIDWLAPRGYSRIHRK
jgi:hypothetical protein